MKEDQFEKDLEKLAKSFLKIRNSDEAKNYAKDLFSKTELKTMVLRYKIATMLFKGIPYVEIERETGASSATIARTSESLKYGTDGMRLIMERMQRAK